jgi:hypothetical protein
VNTIEMAKKVRESCNKESLITMEAQEFGMQSDNNNNRLWAARKDTVCPRGATWDCTSCFQFSFNLVKSDGTNHIVCSSYPRDSLIFVNDSSEAADESVDTEHLVMLDGDVFIHNSPPVSTRQECINTAMNSLIEYLSRKSLNRLA